MLLRMMEVAQENNIDLSSSSVHTLLVGGEPGGSIPATKARIEGAWNAKCSDNYGITEVGIISAECIIQNGLHINEGDYFIEVIEPDSLSPVPDGEIGELVVTSLYRTGHPVIR